MSLFSSLQNEFLRIFLESTESTEIYTEALI